MNLKTKSFLLSLALHVIFILLITKAIMKVDAPASDGQHLPIRIKIDSRNFPSSTKHVNQNPDKKNILKTPNVETSPLAISKQVLLDPLERVATSVPSRQVNPLVSNEKFITTIKEDTSQRVSPMTATKRQINRSLISNDDVSKSLTVTPQSSLNTAASTPSTSNYKVSITQAQGLPGREVKDVSLANVQGLEINIPFERRTASQDIKSYLNYSLHIYEDPSDKAKYFRLSIQVEDKAGTLPTIPKEIIYLIDASNSIGPEMLQEFKKSVRNSFNSLNEGDRFNIFIFNKDMKSMAPEAIPSLKDNHYKAGVFLGDFRVRDTTDVYTSILKTIDLKNTRKPTYVLLLSDGLPTEGVTNPQQIINQIADINKGRLPIFAFGGGVSADQYLLNFLSFTNRGWAEFSAYQVERGIKEMYNHIKDPVLLNLRYYVSGLNEKEIYPKLLPDLFKGSDFVLYGRFTKENLFYLQLWGDAQDSVKQFFITDSMVKGKKGDKSIAENWAMRKMYHLIGLLEYDKDNQDKIKEIKALSKKFNLKIPAVYNLK